jgi:hypothetical protein
MCMLPQKHPIQLRTLVESGFLDVGDTIVWFRPRRKTSYWATIDIEGAIRLADGRTFVSPSSAARAVAGGPAHNGWILWRVSSQSGPLLSELRDRLAREPQDLRE